MKKKLLTVLMIISMLFFTTKAKANTNDYDEMLINLEYLETYTNDFKVQNPAITDSSDILMMRYLRSLRYTDGNWNMLGGNPNTNLETYITSQDTLNNTSVNSLRTLPSIILPNGEVSDVVHMFATMNLALTNDTNADLGGWLGDYCDLILDIHNKLSANATTSEVNAKLDEIFLTNNSGFSMDDFIADLDALNIVKLRQANPSLTYSQIINDYNSIITAKQRVKTFLINRFNLINDNEVDFQTEVYNLYNSNMLISVLESNRGIKPLFGAANRPAQRQQVINYISSYIFNEANYIEASSLTFENVPTQIYVSQIITLEPNIMPLNATVQEITYEDNGTVLALLSTDGLNVNIQGQSIGEYTFSASHIDLADKVEYTIEIIQVQLLAGDDVLNNVDQDYLDNIKNNVLSSLNGDEATRVTDDIITAQEILDIREDGSIAVANLYNGSIIKTETTQTMITSATAKVELITNTTLKTDLKTKITEAQSQLNNNTDAIAKTNALMVDNLITNETTQAKINEAIEAIELVKDETLKTSLNLIIAEAQSQLEAKNEVPLILDTKAALELINIVNKINRVQYTELSLTKLDDAKDIVQQIINNNTYAIHPEQNTLDQAVLNLKLAYDALELKNNVINDKVKQENNIVETGSNGFYVIVYVTIAMTCAMYIKKRFK